MPLWSIMNKTHCSICQVYSDARSTHVYKPTSNKYATSFALQKLIWKYEPVYSGGHVWKKQISFTRIKSRAWMNNRIHIKWWDIIIHLCPNLNGGLWKSMDTELHPAYLMDVIIYPFSNLSLPLLVKEALETEIVMYSISQEICTRFCCALLCCGYAIVHNEFTWSIYPYSSGLLCWHWGNR